VKAALVIACQESVGVSVLMTDPGEAVVPGDVATGAARTVEESNLTRLEFFSRRCSPAIFAAIPVLYSKGVATLGTDNNRRCSSNSKLIGGSRWTHSFLAFPLPRPNAKKPIFFSR
jgi:hypothetical protein